MEEGSDEEGGTRRETLLGCGGRPAEAPVRWFSWRRGEKWSSAAPEPFSKPGHWAWAGQECACGASLGGKENL